MKNVYKISLALVFVIALTGCFAEDYDIGVPTAELVIEDVWHYPLHEATISWHTASENVEQTVEDLEVYTSSLDEFELSSGLRASVQFEANKDNGGDFETSEPLRIFLWKDGEQIEVPLVDESDFQLPIEKGNYILDVQFNNTAGRAQYIGKIVIR